MICIAAGRQMICVARKSWALALVSHFGLPSVLRGREMANSKHRWRDSEKLRTAGRAHTFYVASSSVEQETVRREDASLSRNRHNTSPSAVEAKLHSPFAEHVSHSQVAGVG